MIYIINFPFCNYHSIQRYFLAKKLDCLAVNHNISFSQNDFVVLPGVGTFKEGSAFLAQSGLDITIKDHVSAGGFVIGICLGMQLLLSSSDESPGFNGLNLLAGNCPRIPSSSSFRVPHIGWNSLSVDRNHDILSGIADSSEFFSDYYFVHSYYCRPSDTSSIVASFSHPSGNIPAIISHGNTLGIQFHPEKSGSAGYKLLDNIFLA